MLMGLNYSACELDDPGWVAVADAVQRLERSWQSGGDKELHALLPAADDRLHKAVLIELVKVDQEFRWERGDHKKVEDYVAEWPELSLDAASLSELVEAECLTQAVVDSSVPTAADLQQRFPDVWKQIPLAEIAEQAERERSSHRDTQGSTGLDTDDGLTPNVRVREWMDVPPEIAPLATRYQLMSRLGEGGMGTVYRAFDKQLQREVALKIPRPDLIARPEARASFLREAQAAARIEHPNICTVYDAGELDSVCFITMKLVLGSSLADRVSDGPLDSNEAAETVAKLARALARIHIAGIVHRDIKPANVMIDDGEPLLMDFGLARVQVDDASITNPGVLVGTVPYMSPQQVNGKANAASDIYSLGVVLYELLTGKRPFTGSLADLIVSIRNDTPPAPSSLRPDLDNRLEAICLKCMARQPEDRFQSAEELSLALEEYLQEFTAQSRDDRRDRLTRRTVIRLSAAVAVILLAGVTIFLRTGDGAVEIEIDGKSSTVMIDGKSVEVNAGTVKVSVGRHVIEIIRSDKKKHRQEISIHWRSQKVAVATHRIQGTVFNDANGDGQRQQGEKPLSEKLVWLDLNRDALLDADEPRQEADELGEFRFTGLIPDRYIVRQQKKDGWEQTSPDSLVFDEDFDADPKWMTPHPDRYRWDEASGDYVLTQRNVKGSDSEHTHHDIGFAFNSFHLQYDIQLVSVAYASGVNLGLFADDLNVESGGSCAYLTINYADVAPGVQQYFADLRFFNSNGQSGSTQTWLNVEDAPSDPWVFLTPGKWYHVEMNYDATQMALAAEIRSRDDGGYVGRLLIPDAGPFAADMTRLGSSNCRLGRFQEADREATVRIDNLQLTIPGGPPRVAELSAASPEVTVTFGNQELSEIHGIVHDDTNGDGQRDADESGLPGQTVFIDDNGNSRPDVGERTTTTGDDGCYVFKNVRSGDHIISIDLPKTYKQTLPRAHEWRQFRGQWYALTRMHAKWQLCAVEARSAGGNLATVDDAEQNRWLARQFETEVLPRTPDDKLSAAVWIGLYRQGDRWVWHSGEASGFRSGWWNGEPYKGPGTDHVALLTATQRRGVWQNSLGRPSISGNYPRGVIELPPGHVPPEAQSHVVHLQSAAKLSDFDFALNRRFP